MSKDAEVVRISEVRGKDGSSAYLIEGGKPGEGGISYTLTKEAMHQAEREGKQALQEMLKRGIETSLEGQRGL